MIRRCLFCAAAPEASIPEGRVCRTHAIEFYSGLVAFAIDREREVVEPHQQPPSDLPPRRSYVKRSAYWATTRRRTAAA